MLRFLVTICQGDRTNGGFKMKINELALHGAGYVLGGAEHFLWRLLTSYYLQNNKICRFTPQNLIETALAHPQNHHNRNQLQRAIRNLCGSGKNGPMPLAPLLSRMTGNITPTPHFGITEPEIHPPRPYRVSKALKILEGKRVRLVLRDWEIDSCSVALVSGFKIFVDRGIFETLDIRKIVDIEENP
jgi:hypothetical protein